MRAGVLSAVVLVSALGSLNTAAAQSAVPPPPVTITGVDAASVRPFGRLVITGSGLRPDAAEIAVLVLPGVPETEPGPMPAPVANALATAIPIHLATATEIELIVPPIVDAATGQLTSGRIGLQVMQTDDEWVTTSNVWSEMTVTAMTPLPATLGPGVVTRAFLQSGLAVLSDGATQAAGEADLSAALAAFQTDQQSLADDVGRVAANRDLLVTRPTTDQNPFILDAETLLLTDQLIAAYLEQVVPRLEALAPPAVHTFAAADAAPCVPNTGDPWTDDLICRRQRYGQELAQKGLEAWQQGATLEMTVYLSVFGGWMSSALASAELVTATTAKALQTVWAAATPYVVGYATVGTPPPLSEPLANVGAKLIDDALLAGVPIMASAVTGYGAYAAAAKVAGAANPPPAGDPVRRLIGMLVKRLERWEQDNQTRARRTVGRAICVAGVRGVVAAAGDDEPELQRCDGGEVVTAELAVPDEPGATPTAAAVLPPPDVTQFDGTYTGTYAGRWSIPDTGESGAVSGSALLHVSNGGITVTAPGPGQGSLSPEGRVLIGSVSSDDGTCAFGGRFVVAPQSGRGLANGGYHCDLGDGITASGSWSVVR